MVDSRPWLEDIPYYNRDYLELVHDCARNDPPKAVALFLLDALAVHRMARLSRDDVALVAMQTRPLFTLIDHLGFKTDMAKLEADPAEAGLEHARALCGDVQLRNFRYLQLMRTVARSDIAEAMTLFGIDHATAQRVGRLRPEKLALAASRDQPLFRLIDNFAFKALLVQVEARAPQTRIMTTRMTSILQDTNHRVSRALVTA